MDIFCQHVVADCWLVARRSINAPGARARGLKPVITHTHRRRGLSALTSRDTDTGDVIHQLDMARVTSYTVKCHAAPKQVVVFAVWSTLTSVLL